MKNRVQKTKNLIIMGIIRKARQMPSTPAYTAKPALLVMVKALMLLRVLVVTAFVGAIIFFQVRLELANVIPITILIASTYALTLIYAIALRWVKDLSRFCYMQIAGDVILEGAVIYISGGVDSPFSVLFNFSIISANIILSKRGGYIIATLSSAIFGMLLVLEFYGVAHPIQIYPPSPMSAHGEYVFNIFYLNLCAFYIIAFLSGFLVKEWKNAQDQLVEKSGSLLELQAFHENVVRHMGNGLLTTDTNWRVTSFNDAAETITGFTREEANQRLLDELFPFLRGRVPKEFMETFVSPLIDEGKIRRKDEIEIDIGITLSVLFDKSVQAKGFVMVFQDLTYVKEMESKLVRSERLTAIGQMSASMAHEIRNPLASLSGSIQVLRMELDLSGPNRRLMDIVIEETDRLNLVIAQFLDFANPKPPKLSDVKIGSLIQDTAELLEYNKELTKDVKIRVSLNHADAFSRIDPAQIKQVLWNVCLNGVQAMPDGGRLDITTEKWSGHIPAGEGVRQLQGNNSGELESPVADPSTMLKIDITDQGQGISPDARDKMFEPFFTTKDRGTGLGLATVLRVVEAHGGFITLRSEPDSGATFSIFLPLIPDQGANTPKINYW